MTKANECTCPSGDGSLRWPCPAHTGPFDKLLGAARNESEPDLPPLDEHLAQVYAVGMALSVEQAGGDERAAFFKHLIGRHPAHETEIVRVVEHNYAAWEAWRARAALAQPSPKCATCNDRGHVCLDWEAGAWEECPDCAQAEAERPEMSSERAAYFMRRFKSEEKLLGPNEQAAVDYVLSLIAQHERIVGDLQRQKHEADTALAWATRHYQTVEQERDAALAKLAELEAKLSDPTAVHQWQFSNAWFDGSEEVVLKAGKEGSPIRTLYAAPVAQAQPEETPGEILAAKLIETWVTKHGKPAPWSTAVEITAVATNMPNDERERLLALDDDVDAQAQHSVPEGWMLVECGIWTQEQVDEMQKTVARFRNSEFVDDRALAMAVADAGQCKAPEISLAELLAAEAQALRDERDSQQRVAIKAMEELAALHARVVVVPERDARRMDTEYPEGWNDCLDELARLNGKTVSEGLLRGMGAFAQEIISGALEGGKFDGADLQESAERHGLIAKQVMNEPCRGPEEYCACAWSTSFPTECYRITAELRALLNQDKENGNG
ncbi:TPA: hypothetical protein ACSPPQ_004933 [Pseudomonas aeruginosa]